MAENVETIKSYSKLTDRLKRKYGGPYSTYKVRLMSKRQRLAAAEQMGIIYNPQANFGTNTRITEVSQNYQTVRDEDGKIIGKLQTEGQYTRTQEKGRKSPLKPPKSGPLRVPEGSVMNKQGVILTPGAQKAFNAQKSEQLDKTLRFKFTQNWQTKKNYGPRISKTQENIILPAFIDAQDQPITNRNPNPADRLALIPHTMSDNKTNDIDKPGKIGQIVGKVTNFFDSANAKVNPLTKKFFKNSEFYEKERRRPDPLFKTDFFKKTRDLGIGIEAGAQDMAINKPVTLAAYAGVGYIGGAAFSGITKGSAAVGAYATRLGYPISAAVFTNAPRAIGLGLGGVYAGAKGYEVYKAPTIEARGNVIGRTITELTAFRAGSKLYNYAGIRARSFKVATSKTETRTLWRGLSLEVGRNINKPLIGISTPGKGIKTYTGANNWLSGKSAPGLVYKGPGKIKVTFGTPKINLYAQSPGSAYIVESSTGRDILLNSMRRYNNPNDWLKGQSSIMYKQGHYARELLAKTALTKSAFNDNKLTYDIKQLNKEGISASYKFAKKHDILLYGEAAAGPQKPAHLTRQTSDIDAFANVHGKKGEKLAKEWLNLLKDTGNVARISKQSPTLIETKIKGVWGHGIDLHTIDTANADALSPAFAANKFWGQPLNQDPIFIKGVKLMPLSEQGVRKGASVLSVRMDLKGKLSFGPEAHRGKDWADFFAAEKTLLMSKGQSLDTLNKMIRISPKVDILANPTGKVLLYSPNTGAFSSPKLYAPGPKLNTDYLGNKLSPSLSPSPARSISMGLTTGAISSYSPYSSSPSRSFSPSLSPSMSASISPSVSLSPSMSPSASPSISLSPSISPSMSPSASPSASPSLSPSMSPSVSPSVSPSMSPSLSPSVSPSPSPSPLFRYRPRTPGIIKFDRQFSEKRFKPKIDTGGRKFDYAADLESSFFNIRNIKNVIPKKFTGLESRPLMGLKRKKRGGFSIEGFL